MAGTRVRIGLPWGLLLLIAPFWLAWMVLKALTWPIRRARRERKAEQEATKAAERKAGAEARARGETYKPPASERPRRSRVRRHRRPLQAVYVAAGLALSRPPMGAGPVWGTLATEAVWLALAWFWLGRVRLGQQVWARGMVGAAGLWWFSCGYLPLRVSFGVLAGAAVAVAAARGWHFRIRPPSLPDTSIQDRWVLNVGAQGRALPGTVLGTPRDILNESGIRIGWWAEAIGVAGVHTSVKYRSARHSIGSAYAVGAEQVEIEQLAGQQDESRCVVKVLNGVDGNPLVEVVEFDGSDFDPATGCYTHGRRGDLSGFQVQIYAQPAKPGTEASKGSGARHTWISGGTDSGKSGSSNCLLASITQHGLVFPVIIDFKGGASLANWDGCGIFVPVDTDAPAEEFRAQLGDAMEALAGVRRLGSVRSDQLKATRMRDPATGQDLGVPDAMQVTAANPFIAVVIEEFPKLLAADPAAADEILYMVTMLRYVQIGLAIVTQPTTLQETFKGIEGIRAQFQQGNIIGHRNSASNGGRAFDGVIKVDCSQLPAESGIGYGVSPVDRRDTRIRTRWVRYPALWARSAQIPRLPEHQWAALRPRTRPERAAAEVEARMAIEAAKSRTDDFLEDVWAAVASGGPLKRSEVVSRFRTVSEDAVDRALRKGVSEGRISQPERGLYGPPAPVLATNGSGGGGGSK